MKKKKLFVLDTDNDFQALVKSLCPQDQVEVRFYSSSLEIFSSVGKDKPELIFINLEIPDLNDFVMYDLLKKTNEKSIPVFITYSDQSEKEIKQYKKLKFQAQGYYKKPLSRKDLSGIVENYLELVEDEDHDEFSDENIDKLVRGKLVEVPVKPKTEAPLDETEKELELMTEITPEAEESKMYRSPQADTHEWKQEPEKNLRSQLIVLERQNSNLFQQLKKTEKEKSDLQLQVKELTDQLTDKERELVARNYEFEKSLKKKSDELIQAAEEHLLAELKKQEDSLNRTVSTLAGEKVTLSEKVMTLEQQFAQQQKEMEGVRQQMNLYKNRVKELGELLHQALALTRIENHPAARGPSEGPVTISKASAMKIATKTPRHEEYDCRG